MFARSQLQSCLSASLVGLQSQASRRMSGEPVDWITAFKIAARLLALENRRAEVEKQMTQAQTPEQRQHLEMQLYKVDDERDAIYAQRWREAHMKRD